LNEAERQLRLQAQLLAAIAEVQENFIAGGDLAGVFDILLKALLRATGSAFGMIAEVAPGPADAALRARLIATADSTGAGDSAGAGAVPAPLLTEFDALADRVMSGRAPLIENGPAPDPQDVGLSAGGRPVDAFMGLPFFGGTDMIGLIGLAHRPGGYDWRLAELLTPLLVTAANLLVAWRERQRLAAAEAAAQAERERLSDILTNMGDVVWSATLPDFVMTYVSPSIETVIGYPAERLMREPGLIDELTPPDDLALRNATLEQGMRSGRFDFTHRLRCADGSLRWVRCKAAVLYDANRRPCRLDGILSDITVEREALERARKSDALYRAVVDDQQEAIIRFRPDFTITFANRQYAAFYNLAPEDLLGVHMGDLLAPAEWMWVEREIATLSPVQPTCIHEYEKPLPGGVTRWIRWINRALFDGAGAVTEIQCVGHDVTDLKRLERELESGRELFALAVASSGDGIFDWNISSNEVWYSPRWKEMFGYGDDELPNTYETWEKLIHPDDKQRVLDRVDAYSRNPVGVLRSQARYRHRNGSIVHIESRMIQRQSDDDSQLRVVGAYTDVTAKVVAERRMRDAIESLSDGFAWFDADDRLIMHNERYLEFFPFLRGMGDLTGLPFIDMVCHPDGEVVRMADPETYVAARMKRHREGGSFELPLDGGGWVRVSERQTADRGIVSIWSDITELKQAQQRLLDAVAAMQEGFLLIGPDFKIILSNQRCREMYPVAGHLLMPGVAYEDFLRYAIAHGEFPEASGRPDDFLAEMMDILRSRSDMRIERELAGGRWVLLSQRGMSDGSVVGIRTDLTAQKLRETELEAAHNQLEKQASTLVDLAEKLEQARQSAVEASKAKTRFLAHMSHELRTPLNAILGFAKLIEDELFGPIGVPKYHEYVGLIHESGTHLLSLINDVLDLSKIEAGRMELDRRGVSVEELAAASTRLMEGLAKDRGVKLLVEVLPGCRQVFGDERAIKQMIINLLSNALKFTPPGGRVTLSFAAWNDAAGDDAATGNAAMGNTATRNAGERHASTASGDGPYGGAAVTVVDTGIGMSRDDIVKALDPFGQVDGEIARQHHGTGLGLPLVKAMAEAHGGWLKIESSPGEGTTMTIFLPGEQAIGTQGDDDGASGDRGNGDKGSGAGTGSGGTGPAPIATLDLPASDLLEATVALPIALPRVLLAEDNPMNQRLLLDVLGNLPVRVDCVGDGEAAVDHARRRDYDLILMDIQMPKMGGVAAAQRIRAGSNTGARVPIIALTAHAMEGDRERYLAAGMTDYLTKPVDLLALIELVTRYLGLDFSLTPALPG